MPGFSLALVLGVTRLEFQVWGHCTDGSLPSLAVSSERWAGLGPGWDQEAPSTDPPWVSPGGQSVQSRLVVEEEWMWAGQGQLLAGYGAFCLDLELSIICAVRRKSRLCQTSKAFQ